MAWVDAVVQGVLLGGLYALFAIGLSLIFGVMRLVNLAHGDFIVLAAFLAVVVVEALRRSARSLALAVVVPVMFGARLRCCSAGAQPRARPRHRCRRCS